jgi:hypothetical protein
MDQGGELWHSNELRNVAFAAGHDFESTGADAASENGKVERANGIFGTMVRCLLYSTGLHPRFWSAALVHAVYLKNRLYHKALCMTPQEASTGEKPSLAHLCTFGTLVTARKTGKRPAKADHHTDHGILIGYGSTHKYVDQTMNHDWDLIVTIQDLIVRWCNGVSLSFHWFKGHAGRIDRPLTRD